MFIDTLKCIKIKICYRSDNIVRDRNKKCFVF